MATVLVVDDEPVVREVVVRYLKREGWPSLVREAARGSASRFRGTVG
jgi:CheY-like chemotaxis protein